MGEARGRDYSVSACARVARQLLNAALFERQLESVAEPAVGEGPCTLYFRLQNRPLSVRARRGLCGRLWVEAPGYWDIEARRERPWDWSLIELLVAALPGTAATMASLQEQLAATCRWSSVVEQERNTGDRRGLTGPALEARLDEGHPYHPCFRARVGFDGRDHALFSPESGAEFALHWLLVPRQALQLRGVAASDPWSLRLLPAQTRAQLLGRALQHGRAPADFAPMPVHPWQWAKVLKAQWPRLADTGILDIGELGSPYTATQSIRTLAPLGEGAHLKLSLGITNTSAPRNLHRYGLQAGVLISDWLIGLLDADPFFRRHPLRLLPEFATAAIVPDRLADQAGATSLGALWREPPPAECVVMNALTGWEADGLPFIDPWVRRFGLEPWLQRLLEVVLVPCWGLLTRAGVAVEAHAQNTLLMCVDGWPEAICLRDTHESLEYVPALLPKQYAPPAFDTLPEFDPPAGAGNCYWMSSAEDLFELFSDTLLTYHLSDLAHLLQLAYGYSEKAFARVLADTLRACAGDCPGGQWPLAAPRWRAEPLLARKLGGQCGFTVPNPLVPRLRAAATSSNLRSGVAVDV